MIKVLRTQGGVVRLEQWKEEERGQLALEEQCAGVHRRQCTLGDNHREAGGPMASLVVLLTVRPV